jgi:L-rhamnose mutarotase
MERIACRMKVFEGCYDEYKRRHDQIWPEMKEELKRHGYRSYSIYLDRETGYLYSYAEVTDKKLADQMSDTPVNRKWWHYMKDVMETNEDESPKSILLSEVFHLE